MSESLAHPWCIENQGLGIHTLSTEKWAHLPDLVFSFLGEWNAHINYNPSQTEHTGNTAILSRHLFFWLSLFHFPFSIFLLIGGDDHTPICGGRCRVNLDQLPLPLKLSPKDLPPQCSGALGPEKPSSPTLSPQQRARYRTRGFSSLYKEHPVSVQNLYTSPWLLHHLQASNTT